MNIFVFNEYLVLYIRLTQTHDYYFLFKYERINERRKLHTVIISDGRAFKDSEHTVRTASIGK